MPPTRSRGRLSRDVVVHAAIELLDEHGERGLTFKLLTEKLQTGAGAVYWHVANKDELVTMATDQVIGTALAGLSAEPGTDAETRIRALALAVYDTLDLHTWAAPHVTAVHTMPHTMLLLERIGGLLAETQLPAGRHFAVATAIFIYLTSVTAQDAGRASAAAPGTTRDDLLRQEAQQWAALDPQTFPFVTGIAADLGNHDDRDQFLTGLDLLLDGLRSQVSATSDPAKDQVILAEGDTSRPHDADLARADMTERRRQIAGR
ncbi:TetR/AcrR family transcriptional regulator [Actinoplanes derwentensis]|uniref:Tetracyclin repressor, C-terminal all-alpha domain n=1 Tax=Actinoplanes derwentensis TaxID=113562 RepID=A0A1H1S5G1_9ACTN|nr:TetR/AcrR family transcriptional regulator C-terminal domain-containing protein [Actinoplanes derwentensis]GID89672.1 TetR family transcriptional regulator [Actinoplanes derwentensis]SDS43008.1 Tetracyclin repressor, C-terminal all-alpha domain [Actinoplanes derwentensis]